MDFYFFEDQHNHKVFIEEFLNDSSDDNRNKDEQSCSEDHEGYKQHERMATKDILAVSQSPSTATSAQLSNADNITTVTNQSTIQSYRLIMTFVYGFTNVPVDAKR